MNVKKELEKRGDELRSVLKECDAILKKEPEGRLKIVTKKGIPYYYIRRDGNDPTGKYLNRKNIDKAKKLAQRDYELIIRKVVSEEMKAITLFTQTMPQTTYEHVYDNLIDGRKVLITPHFLPDSEFINKWLSEPYDPLAFEDNVAEHYTIQGERVRSKSEVLIANALNSLGLAYKYECPLFLGDKKVYPDFTIMKMPSRKTVYWEHLGLLDNPEYLSKNLKKLDFYEEQGIFIGDNLIITRETSDKPLNIKQVQRLIEHHLL